MPKAVDLTGQKFGKLTVKENAGRMNGHNWWYCECDCGQLTLNSTSSLNAGRSKSCGCAPKNYNPKRGKDNPRFKHGGCTKNQSPEYTVWVNLRSDTRRTGEVPKEWDDYQQFFKDVGWRPSAEHVIARHDVREPHGPTNTYWRNENEEREYRNSLRMCDEFVIHMRAIIDPGPGETTGTGEEGPRLFTWNPPPQGNRTTAERPWFAMFPSEEVNEDTSPSRSLVARESLVNSPS
jgi:hypothetical protein